MSCPLKSDPVRAKWRATTSWPSPRTLTAKCPLAMIVWPVVDPLFMQISNVGGSRETEDSALAVVP